MMMFPRSMKEPSWRRSPGLRSILTVIIICVAAYPSVNRRNWIVVSAQPNHNSQECGRCPNYCLYFYHPESTDNWRFPRDQCELEGQCHCEGFCCIESKSCPQPAVGCGGVCCERGNDEVQKGFWDRAGEDAAQWFLKRAFRYAMGGCGIACNFVIGVFFSRQRRPGILMSVDCWKLQSNETNRERASPSDRNYPILDNALFTSAVNETSVAERKKQHDSSIAEINDQAPWKHGDAEVDGAFVMKINVPETHSNFIRAGVPGSIYWLEEHVKLLYDEYSGCTECCRCSIWISQSDGGKECLKRCSKNVKIDFNYNILDYPWPDWEYSEELAASDRSYKYYNTPRGDFFRDPLIFDALKLSNLTPADEIHSFPRGDGENADGVSLGCHIYPHPWNNERSGAGSVASRNSRGVMATAITTLYFLL